MRRLAEGQPGPWAVLSEAERDARLAQAAKLWQSTETALRVSWSELSERQQIFTARIMPIVHGDTDPIHDTHLCLWCEDRALVPNPPGGAWYCQHCEAGLMAEAGYWRDVRYPHEGRKRRVSEYGKRKFLEYCAVRPKRADELRHAIAEVVRRERQAADTPDGVDES